jgi:hypothetical protein
MISLTPARFCCLIALALAIAIACCSTPLRLPFASVIRKDGQFPFVSRVRDLWQTKIHATSSWVFFGLFMVFLHPGAVESYIAGQTPIAKAGILANIGPSGARSSGAKVS